MPILSKWLFRNSVFNKTEEGFLKKMNLYTEHIGITNFLTSFLSKQTAKQLDGDLNDY